jgi:long-subunit fatty acid transport protein
VSRVLAAAAAALALLASRGAAADPLDTFGFGARASGMAGAVTAASTGAAAAHANPAAVALAKHPELTLGWGYGAVALELDGRDAQLLDAHGTDVGLAIPFRIGSVSTAFGLALYLPDQFIARIQLIPATEPHFVLLDNDVHRIVVEPVLSIRPLPWLSIGGGVSLLADAAGRGVSFEVGVEGGEPVGESALDVALPTRAAPLAGLLVMPHERIRLGLTYRGEVDLSLRLAILADVDVAGVVAGDVLIDVRSISYYTPQRLTGGLAVDVLPDLTLSADVAWIDWSSFDGSIPDLRLLINLGIAPPLVETLFPEEGFHDVVVPRVGFEWRVAGRRLDLALRGGWAFEASPVPAQVGLTSFADNDRHVFALGAGVRFRAFDPILTRPISLDLGLQWHHLRDKLTIKDQTAFPGRSFTSGGDMLRAGLTMSVEF